MATNDTQSDAASPTADDDLPDTVEYSDDVDEQDIKLNLANRVNESDAVTGIEELSIDEQEDGTQIATVTWESADDASARAAAADDPAAEQDDDADDIADTDTAGATDDDAEDDTETETEAESPAADEPTEVEPAPETDADENETASDEDEDETDADEDEIDIEEAKTDAVEPSEETSRPTTFEATIQVGNLRTALASVDALVDECRFHLDHDGLTIRAVDAANVAMTELQLSNEAFDAYQADTGTIGLDLERFLDAVTMGDKDDLVQFALDPEMRKLVIAIDNLEFTIALIDPETIRAEPDIPDLDLPAQVTCRTADLDRAVTATDMVADHLRLAVDPDAALFVAEAQGDTDSVRVERGADDLEAFTPGDAGSLFSLDYLNDIVGAIPRDTDVTVDLGDDFPLKLTYTLADGHGDIDCMLAPRIQEE